VASISRIVDLDDGSAVDVPVFDLAVNDQLFELPEAVI
jgi:hypothetical protein